MKITLSEFFLHLLSDKNFYARIANSMQRVEAPGVGTMGVGLRDGRVVLYYDPAFIGRISVTFGVFTIEHEILHIVLDHIPRYHELLARLGNDEEQRRRAEIVANIAMDCADNDLLRKHKDFERVEQEFKAYQLEKLPDALRDALDENQLKRAGLVLPEKYGLPPGKTFEFYQEELMKRVKFLPPLEAEMLLQEMLGALDGSHERWRDTDADGNSKPVLSEESQGLAHQLRTQFKQIVKNAIKEQIRSRGTVPSEIAEWLEEYLADPIIPWWEVLTTRIKATKRSKPDRGIQRPNRSLLSMSEEDESILPAIGVVRDPMYRVFFYVDTSGSMNSDSLAIARAELSHMLRADEDLEVRYMQGDAITHFDQVFRTGQELPREVHGRGGTDFNEYFRYMWRYVGNDDTTPDLVIVYTDGWAPAVAPEYRLPQEIPLIWLVTKNHAIESLEDYGEVIVCDPEHNETWKYANKK